MNKIVLWIDVVSPWSRIAFEVLPRYQAAWDADVVIRPANLGYIMKFSGNRPPISVANKGVWMWQDMQRASAFFRVPLHQPASFPVNTQYCQTLLRCIEERHPTLLRAAFSVLFDAIWGEKHPPVATHSDLRAILEPHKLLPTEQLESLLQEAFSAPRKQQLQQEAKRLVDEGGCFGMPWFEVTRHSDGAKANFFGADRFEQMAAFLGKPYRGPYGDGSPARL